MYLNEYNNSMNGCDHDFILQYIQPKDNQMVEVFIYVVFGGYSDKFIYIYCFA